MQWVRVILSVLLLSLVGCGPDPAPSGGSASAVTSVKRSASASNKPVASSATVSAPASASATPAPTGKPIKVGVTLHPYYSWTKNVVGDIPDVEVIAVLPGDVDAGSYQPRPEDIKKLSDLDAIVINGLGHDDFITEMIKASGNTKLTIIKPNDGAPTLKGAHGEAVNSHTFISFTNAIQQTYAIEKALAALRPDLAEHFATHAKEYAQKLRGIKDGAAKELANAKIKRVVTVHDGYSYLCQEFAIEVAGVVQPAHGLVPSAEELGGMVDLLKKEKITVVFSEESFPDKLLTVLKDSAKVKVYIITHIASGEYTADKFEKEMQQNADTLVKALVTDG